MKSRFWLSIRIILIIGVLVLTAGCTEMADRMEEFAAAAEFHTPELTDIPDGEYLGTFRSGIVRVKVKVSMDSGRIRDIKILRHFNGRGEAAEVIVDDILSAQSLNVDVVSGATYSSKVILKAVELGLKKGSL